MSKTTRTLLGVTAAFLLGASMMRADTTVLAPTTAPLATATAGNITVAGTGSIIVGNTNAHAISFTESATLDNSGTIENTNTGGRVLRATTAGKTVSVINRATGRIISAAGDAFQVSQANVNVSVVNDGVIQVLNGGQALDWNSITTGTNTVTNNATGQILAKGADSIRTGTNGIVHNYGTIAASLVIATAPTETDPLKIGSAASGDGIDAQDDRSGAQIFNYAGGVIEGRHGITGGSVAGLAYTMAIDNAAGATIRGLNGAGINIDGVFTNAVTTVTNRGLISGRVDSSADYAGGAASLNGDGDGVDVDGISNITNYGTISATGAKGVGSDGQTNIADGISIGGGTVDNKAGAIISSVGRGILVDNSGGGAAIAALTLTNAGSISADNGAAVVTKGSFGNSITNTGSITGGGTYTTNTDPVTNTVVGGPHQVTQAAIELGSGADTVTTSGSITSHNGLAIRMGAGEDTLNIGGGIIVGSVDGGAGKNALNFTLGSGGTFHVGDAVRNFRSINSNAGTLTMDATATLEWVFEGDALVARGDDYGAVNVTGGSFVVASGAVLKIMNLAGVDYSDIAWDSNRSFLIVDATGAVSLTGEFVLDASLAGNFGGEGSWSLAQNGTQVSANWTAVPEPAEYGLMGAAGALLVARMRRRRKVA